MKILIINAYSKSHQKAFKQFERNLKQIFLGQNELLDTETEFFIRDLHNLDDFLYELDSIYVSSESARLFDFIDMIFIQGESNIRPWSPQTTKFLLLLKMCLMTQKIVFASTFAMNCLVYLCATNFEKPINVINGLDGSQLESFYHLDPETMNLTSRDLFLDNVTGDFYVYSSFSHEWMPVANAGIHSNRSAQTFNTIGKYMIKAPVYKPQPRMDKFGVFLQRNYETIVSIKKIHIQNWVLKDVDMEFVVAAKSSWDVHPFNFVNAQKTFITLAESPRGPAIIQIGENIIGVQFSIEEEYNETLKIFRNFVQSKLKVITNMNDKDRLRIEKLVEGNKRVYIDPLIAAINDNQGNRQMRNLGGVKRTSQNNIDKNVSSYIKIRPTSAKTFSHAGFASKKSEMLDIIDNNAILANNTVPANLKPRNANNSMSLITKNLGTSSCENFLKSEEDSDSIQEKKKKKNKEIQPKVNSRPQTAKILMKTNFSDEFEKSPRGGEKNGTSDDFSKKYKFGPNKTMFEMRRMLHPNTNPENLPVNQELWVPGNYSKTKEAQKQRIASASSVGTLVSSKSSIVLKPKYTLAQTLFSCYSKYKDCDPDDCRRKPIVRVSAPYNIEKIMEKEKQIRDKTLNKGADKFDLGKPTTNFIPNYVNLTLSNPPANHKFREEAKEKWVSKRNFRLS